MKNDMKEEIILFLHRFKFRTIVVLLLLMMLLAACVYNAGRDSIDRTTVTMLKLDSLMGRWYEIARFDHNFERGLKKVTADYRLQDDGSIEVINTGMRGDKPHQAIGKAKTTNQPGRLRVSFFWIFYSDYNILEMGANGEWALVGSRSPRYLWILSRTPALPDATINHIIDVAERRGYNTRNLIFDEP